MKRLIIVSNNDILKTICDYIEYNSKFAYDTVIANITVFNNPNDKRLIEPDIIINACNPLENNPELDAKFYAAYKEADLATPIYRMSFKNRADGFSKMNVMSELSRIELSAITDVANKQFDYRKFTLKNKYEEIKDEIKPAESLMEEDRIYPDFELD